jgi:hypothetical protein
MLLLLLLLFVFGRKTAFLCLRRRRMIFLFFQLFSFVHSFFSSCLVFSFQQIILFTTAVLKKDEIKTIVIVNSNVK